MSDMDVSLGAWRKSSRSAAQGNCVEIAPAWRKSSRSNSQGQNCVELAEAGDAVALRDSKNPEQGHFEVSRAEFGRLVSSIKRS